MPFTSPGRLPWAHLQPMGKKSRARHTHTHEEETVAITASTISMLGLRFMIIAWTGGGVSVSKQAPKSAWSRADLYSIARKHFDRNLSRPLTA